MEFAIPVAGCSNDFGELFACSTMKTANYSPTQKAIVKSESLPVCFCCLASETPLVNAERCNHTEFVKLYFQREHSSKLWICCLCHYMLVKIEAFRRQIYKCFENRNSKVEQPNKWKLLNNLSLKAKISLISLGDNEKPMDPGYDDPLFTAEVSVKIENQDCKAGFNELLGFDEFYTQKSVKTYNATCEPKSDLDSDGSMNATISSYLNTSTSKRTDKRTKNKPSKSSTTIETRLQRATRSKKEVKQDSQGEITPIRRVTNKKVKKSVKKITKKLKKKVNKSIKEKLVESQKDDDIPNVVINHNLYKGKIQTIELTREELEKERQNEREKESWKKQKFKCESCLKGFKYSYVLETHNKRHHKMLDGKSVKTCDICKCMLSNNSSYRQHFKRHFTRYVCMECDTRSDDLPKMARHYTATHSDIDSKQMEYKCSYCNFTTYTRRIYNYHKRRLHEAKLCSICNKEFTGGISYNFHMKLCHSQTTGPGRPQVYECNSCPRVYDKKSSCNAHMRAAHGAPPAVLPYCPTCDKHFKHISSYRYHLKTTLVHNNGINNYVCDYCGREFRYKPPLRDHIEIQHLNIWNYRCEPCNKTFSSKNLQMKHIQYVHENKQIPKNKICQFCGKGFAGRKTLQCHIRRHTGERPLECEFCGDTFAHDAALYTHRKLKHKVPRKREKKQVQHGLNLNQRDKNSVGDGQNMFQTDNNSVEEQNMLQRDKNSVGDGQNMFQRDKNSVGDGLNMFQRDKTSVGDGQNMFQRDKNSVGDGQNMLQRDKNSVEGQNILQRDKCSVEGQNMFQKDKKQLLNSVEQTQLIFQAQMYNMYSNK